MAKKANSPRPNSPKSPKSPKSPSTEAPTSGVTKSAEESAKGDGNTSREELDFASLMHQYYLIHGKLMPIKTAIEEYNFTENEFATLYNSPTVRIMLKERDVIFRSTLVEELNPEGVKNLTEEEKKDWRLKGLTPTQLIVANSMLDLVDSKSEKKRLQDLNVSTKQWDAWMSDPVFSSYMRDRAESMLGNSQHIAHLALLDRVRSGDLVAIKYANEMTGRFIQNPQQPPSTSTSNNVVINNGSADIKGILGRVIEIIIDEVDDPQIAARIGDKLRGLMGAQTIAGQLVREEEPIVVPEIMPPAELTATLQKRLDGPDAESGDNS